jgi:hypothetical protein
MSIGTSWVLMTGATLAALGLLLTLFSFLVNDNDTVFRTGQRLAFVGVVLLTGTLLFHGFAGLLARTP